PEVEQQLTSSIYVGIARIGQDRGHLHVWVRCDEVDGHSREEVSGLVESAIVRATDRRAKAGRVLLVLDQPLRQIAEVERSHGLHPTTLEADEVTQVARRFGDSAVHVAEISRLQVVTFQASLDGDPDPLRFFLGIVYGLEGEALDAGELLLHDAYRLPR